MKLIEEIKRKGKKSEKWKTENWDVKDGQRKQEEGGGGGSFSLSFFALSLWRINKEWVDKVDKEWMENKEGVSEEWMWNMWVMNEEGWEFPQEATGRTANLIPI